MVAEFEESDEEQYLCLQLVNGAVRPVPAEILRHILKLAIVLMLALADVAMVDIVPEDRQQDKDILKFLQVGLDVGQGLAIEVDIQNGVDP